MPAADVFSKNICSAPKHYQLCHATRTRILGQVVLLTLLQQQVTLCSMPKYLTEPGLDMNILNQIPT